VTEELGRQGKDGAQTEDAVGEREAQQECCNARQCSQVSEAGG